MADTVRVQVVRAWPRRHDSIELVLAPGATVAEAITASAFGEEGVAGFAVLGERVEREHRLRDGDRLELLRPLQVDPKEARRLRAAQRPR